MKDIRIIIFGKTWHVIDGIDGLAVETETAEQTEDFVVVDPSSRRILIPDCYTHSALGSAIVRAIEVEETLQARAARGKAEHSRN